VDSSIKALLISPYCYQLILEIHNEKFVLTLNGLNERPITDKMIEYFVKIGYQKCDAIFLALDGAKEFLARKYVDFHKTQGNPLYLNTELRELINYIDLDDVIKYLNMIEAELLPQGKYEIVKEMVMDLYNINCVHENLAVHARVKRILEICNKLKYI
jgi:hypothetical protein